jgi:hypothetical protein
MTYHPDPRSRFVKVRLMPSGELIELPVHRLQKPQQGRWYRAQEYVMHQGNVYLLPECWAHLAHVFEIQGVA